jgi:hypothetical protein
MVGRMRRRSVTHAAVRTAFARAADEPAGAGGSVTFITRIRPEAMAFVVGFPGAIGAIALVAAASRAGVSDGAFPLGAGLLAGAAALLLLGLRSFIRVGPTDMTVRFFGVRANTVKFDRLASATFGMSFPSISYGIALMDHEGRRVIVHANWWRNEPDVVRPVMRALVDHDVAMDRTTARLVARTLGIARPKARIVHRARFRPDRTW